MAECVKYFVVTSLIHRIQAVWQDLELLDLINNRYISLYSSMPFYIYIL